MPETTTLQVSVDVTERLDRFLADQLSISRAQAARLVGVGAVPVNGTKGRAGRGLSKGDLVAVTYPEAEAPRTIKPFDTELSIVYEDDWMLVLDKPAGLVVHPAPGHWDDTLVNALAARGTALSATATARAPSRAGMGLSISPLARRTKSTSVSRTVGTSSFRR